MTLKVRVISQQPPGGRCTLYADYADALARHFATRAEVVFSETRGAHGDGFPSLCLNDVAVQPEDGAILMPADIIAELVAQGVSADAMAGIGEVLEEPLSACWVQRAELPRPSHPHFPEAKS